MGKVEAAAQPEMENLLASIKKAIHDEAGGQVATGEAGSEGAVFRGTMRELRVKMTPDEGSHDAAPSGDILDLRNKISAQLGSREQSDKASLHSATAAVTTPPASRPGGFAGLLSGEASPLRKIADQIEREKPPIVSRGSAGFLSENDYRSTEPPRRASRDEWERPAQPYLPSRDIVQSRAYGSDPTMMSGETTAAASAAFGRLADSLVSRALSERPIEEIAREMLRGMLKQWLDDNLPDLVERLVREEIARVARRSGGR